MPDEYLDPRLFVTLPEIPDGIEIKPVTESLQFEVTYIPPVEFNISNHVPELHVGAVGLIEFPDGTVTQMIVTEVSDAEVKGVMLENPNPGDRVENPVFKIRIPGENE